MQIVPMASSTEQFCGYNGDPDLYGLGIRIAFYLQWTSAFIMRFWYPAAEYARGRRELQNSNVLFTLALTITLIVITADSGPFYAADIIILSYIILGGTYAISFLPASIRLHASQHTTAFSVFLTAGFYAILATSHFYYAWFWLHGAIHRFLLTDCGVYLFLFTKISIDNGSATKFLGVVSMIVGLCYFMAFVTLVTLSRKPRTNNEKDSPGQKRQSEAGFSTAFVYVLPCLLPNWS